MQQNVAVSAAPPLGRGCLDFAANSTALQAREAEGIRVAELAVTGCMQEEEAAFAFSVCSSPASFCSHESQGIQQQVQPSGRLASPLTAAYSASASPGTQESVCVLPFVAPPDMLHPVEAPGAASSLSACAVLSPQQLFEPTPARPQAPPVSATEPAAETVQQTGEGLQQLHTESPETACMQQQQQHPVRYDSALDMWVVVVPSKGSRHLLFASKFCVKKRGYAEARRRALASYQRFLQLGCTDAAATASPAAAERSPETVSNPSMFFSRAKEAWCTQWYEGTRRIFKSFSCRVYGHLAEPLCGWFLEAVRRDGRRPSSLEVESQFVRLRRSLVAEGEPRPAPADLQAAHGGQLCLPASCGAPLCLQGGQSGAPQQADAGCLQWPQASCQQIPGVHRPSAEAKTASLHLGSDSKAELLAPLRPLDGGLLVAAKAREASAASLSEVAAGRLDGLEASNALVISVSEGGSAHTAEELTAATRRLAGTQLPPFLPVTDGAAAGPRPTYGEKPLASEEYGATVSAEAAGSQQTCLYTPSIAQQQFLLGGDYSAASPCAKGLPPLDFAPQLGAHERVSYRGEHLPQERRPPLVAAEALP
ncbi:hypothetical protein Efla_003719 [Eimeria flavescens]